MGDSHDRDTPDPPDQGDSTRSPGGGPYPKGIGRGNGLGGKEYYPGPQPGQGSILPFEAEFIFPLWPKTPSE